MRGVVCFLGTIGVIVAVTACGDDGGDQRRPRREQSADERPEEQQRDGWIPLPPAGRGVQRRCHFDGRARLQRWHRSHRRCGCRWRSRLCSHLLTNDTTQSLVPEAHVHRLERHVDRGPMRDHVDTWPNADTAARRRSASNPASPRTTTLPTSIAMIARAVDPAGTNFANVGALACRAACIYQ